MKYSHLPDAPGAYMLLNTANGKFYVGGSVNMRRRVRGHLAELRKGSHGNPHLQRAWNKHGSNCFVATVLEQAESAKRLVDVEQFWLNKLFDKARSYNILEHAFSTRGRGLVQSRASIEQGSWAKSTPISGYITPEGHPVTLLNVGLFSRERKLAAPTMYALSKGEATSCKGWTHVNAKPKAREWIGVYEGFIAPDGTETPPFSNLERFCRERGLDASYMRKIYRGKRLEHKRWTHRDAPERITHKVAKRAAVYTGFIAPDGRPTAIENLTAFCRQNGLDQASMYKVIQGKQGQHKGWKYDRSLGKVEQISYKQR